MVRMPQLGISVSMVRIGCNRLTRWFWLRVISVQKIIFEWTSIADSYDRLRVKRF
jgi:hypothetical protein